MVLPGLIAALLLLPACDLSALTLYDAGIGLTPGSDNHPGIPATDAGPGQGDAGIPDGDRDASAQPGPGPIFDAGARDAGTLFSPFPYNPSNFPASTVQVVTAGATLDCGTSTFNTGTMLFNNWCGNAPPPAVRVANGSGSLVVLAFGNLRIAANSRLEIQGPNPVAIAVLGDVQIDGTLRAAARGTAGGPGSSTAQLCGTSAGGAVTATSSSGGGGGGDGTPGGNGGGSPPGSGGVAGPIPGPTLTPLLGGCPGGQGSDGAPGGGGGGAIQVSSATTITINGAIAATGGGGANANSAQATHNGGGGGGGGSGGAILLEAQMIKLGPSARLSTSGGGGGEGGRLAHDDGTDGSSPQGAVDVTTAAPGGGNGDGATGGAGAAATTAAGSGSVVGSSGSGGGGGGGAGVLRMNATLICLVEALPPWMSGSITSNGAPGCP